MGTHTHTRTYAHVQTHTQNYSQMVEVSHALAIIHQVNLHLLTKLVFYNDYLNPTTTKQQTLITQCFHS